MQFLTLFLTEMRLGKKSNVKHIHMTLSGHDCYKSYSVILISLIEGYTDRAREVILPRRCIKPSGIYPRL